MKYYIIAGEASGDLHASNLIKHIFNYDSNAEIRAWGGERMQQEGADVVKNYKDLAFMGFVEVARNLKTILANIRFCKKDILAFRPDVVILIDYPGFNLRIAKFLKQQRIKTFYYISPQIWAWHTSRVKQIKANIDQMFVILPFEKEFYASYNINVHYHGHPLLDAIKNSVIDKNFIENNRLNTLPIIAILPGSRKQEIKNMLKVMIEVSKQIKDYQFVIAGVEHLKNLYEDIVNNESIRIVYNQTYSLLAHSYAAMVTSGTATLEAALFDVPQVVCYKGNYFSYLIAKQLIKNIRYISLVNLIAEKKIVQELIQNDMNEALLLKELRKIIYKEEDRKEMLNEYKIMHEKLGDGNTSSLIAKKMIDLLSNQSLG
ncbi:MAG TPA: lipid-A-disaccharide synthase [Bacteroidales bacterium]|jgi:lipid-A-disaccharide synthase|nr:lipid-A-disaccharide synthase [Bacteroidales bacterium]HQB19195.1 lipid-A-disaccharide synthase [Bacteroidales bacterium]